MTQSALLPSLTLALIGLVVLVGMHRDSAVAKPEDSGADSDSAAVEDWRYRDLRGRLIDSDGDPIVGATISVANWSHRSLRGLLPPEGLKVTRSDENGQFEFRARVGGVSSVDAYAPGDRVSQKLITYGSPIGHRRIGASDYLLRDAGEFTIRAEFSEHAATASVRFPSGDPAPTARLWLLADGPANPATLGSVAKDDVVVLATGSTDREGRATIVYDGFVEQGPVRCVVQSVRNDDLFVAHRWVYGIDDLVDPFVLMPARDVRIDVALDLVPSPGANSDVIRATVGSGFTETKPVTDSGVLVFPAIIPERIDTATSASAKSAPRAVAVRVSGDHIAEVSKIFEVSPGSAEAVRLTVTSERTLTVAASLPRDEEQDCYTIVYSVVLSENPAYAGGRLRAAHGTRDGGAELRGVPISGCSISLVVVAGSYVGGPFKLHLDAAAGGIERYTVDAPRDCVARGVVVDGRGSGVPGVVLATRRNVDDELEFITQTDSQGRFWMPRAFEAYGEMDVLLIRDGIIVGTRSYASRTPVGPLEWKLD